MEPFLPAHTNLCVYSCTSDLGDVLSFSRTPGYFLDTSWGKVALAPQPASQIPDAHTFIPHSSHMLLNSLHDHRFAAPDGVLA